MIYHSILYVLIGLTLVSSQGQTPNEFCQGVPDGSYCSNSLTGYYWCVSGGSNSFQTCGSGTECSCFIGPSCENVPTVGTFSPCNRHQVTPLFASSSTMYETANIAIRNPSCTLTGTSTKTTLISSSGKGRVDTNKNVQQSCGSSTSQFQTSEWFFTTGSSISHYTYQVSSGQCTKETITGILPNSRVPDGYQYLGSNTYSGAYFPSQTTNVWYYLYGNTYPSQPYGYWDEIHVSSYGGSLFPLYRNRRDDNFRVITWTNATTITYTQGEPDASYFSMPSACSSL